MAAEDGSSRRHDTRAMSASGSRRCGAHVVASSALQSGPASSGAPTQPQWACVGSLPIHRLPVASPIACLRRPHLHPSPKGPLQRKKKGKGPVAVAIDPDSVPACVCVGVGVCVEYSVRAYIVVVHVVSTCRLTQAAPPHLFSHNPIHLARPRHPLTTHHPRPATRPPCHPAPHPHLHHHHQASPAPPPPPPQTLPSPTPVPPLPLHAAVRCMLHCVLWLNPSTDVLRSPGANCRLLHPARSVSD